MGRSTHYFRSSVDACVRILARNTLFFVMEWESQGNEAGNMSKPPSGKEVVTDCYTVKTAFWYMSLKSPKVLSTEFNSK